MKGAKQTSRSEAVGLWVGRGLRGKLNTEDAEHLVRMAAVYLDWSRQIRGLVLAKVGAENLERVVREAQRRTGRQFDASTAEAFLADGSFKGSPSPPAMVKRHRN